MARIYDQATATDEHGNKLCGNCGNCPVVEVDKATGKVEIFDPAFPDHGSFTFKNEDEATKFFQNAPTAFASYLASKKA